MKQQETITKNHAARIMESFAEANDLRIGSEDASRDVSALVDNISMVIDAGIETLPGETSREGHRKMVKDVLVSGPVYRLSFSDKNGNSYSHNSSSIPHKSRFDEYRNNLGEHLMTGIYDNSVEMVNIRDITAEIRKELKQIEIMRELKPIVKALSPQADRDATKAKNMNRAEEILRTQMKSTSPTAQQTPREKIKFARSKPLTDPENLGKGTN